MNICPNCQKITDENIKFCSVCGTKMVTLNDNNSSVEEPEQPVYDPLYNAQPAYYEQYSYSTPSSVTVSEPGKVKKIIGFILSIGGFVLSIFSVLYCLTTLGTGYGLDAFIYGFSYGIEGLALSIVGNVLSNKSIKEGNQTKMAKRGVTFSTIGIILSAFGILLAFVAVFVNQNSVIFEELNDLYDL